MSDITHIQTDRQTDRKINTSSKRDKNWIQLTIKQTDKTKEAKLIKNVGHKERKIFRGRQ